MRSTLGFGRQLGYVITALWMLLPHGADAASATSLSGGGQAAGGVTYGHLAEGLTSARPGGAILAGYRMFSVPDMEGTCSRARATTVAALRNSTPQLRLRVGRPFELQSLEIDALDTHRTIVPRVPIAIEVDSDSNLLDTTVADGGLRPLKAGRTSLRVRTVCPGATTETLVPVTISP